MTAYYNEIDPTAAHVLECLIKDSVIAPGVVDRRSIADVEPSDVKEFKQAHFFAGGGIWSVAARLAGWPDDRQLWTGSCPCQPFSVAGKGAGENDPRHLWPHFFRLINAVRPPIAAGEQVSGAAGLRWIDGVFDDLESADYAVEAFNLSACSVNAPHIRQRLYWRAVVNANRSGRGEHSRSVSISSQQPSSECSGGDSSGDLDDAQRNGWGARGDNNNEYVRDISSPASKYGSMADADGGGRGRGPEIQKRESEQGIIAERPSFWHDTEWIHGADGKTRRIKPGIRLLVNAGECVGRVSQLRIAGNAIVAPLAAQFLRAIMETENV